RPANALWARRRGCVTGGSRCEFATGPLKVGGKVFILYGPRKSGPAKPFLGVLPEGPTVRTGSPLPIAQRTTRPPGVGGDDPQAAGAPAGLRRLGPPARPHTPCRLQPL